MDELDFFEVVSTLMVFFIHEQEPSIGQDVRQHGCKGTLRVAIGMPFALAVKALAIAERHVATIPNSPKTHEKSLEKSLSGEFLVQELAEGYRVGGIAQKDPLVDIQANADDAVLDSNTLQAILDEHAAEFAIADIDIIGPLNGRLS